MHSPLVEGGPVCIFRSPKFLLKFVEGITPGVKKTWVDMLDYLANLDDQNVQYEVF